MIFFKKAISQGIRDGLNAGFAEGLKSDAVQSQFDKLSQHFYDLGREHEKAQKPHLNIANERAARAALEKKNEI